MCCLLFVVVRCVLVAVCSFLYVWCLLCLLFVVCRMLCLLFVAFDMFCSLFVVRCWLLVVLCSLIVDR